MKVKEKGNGEERGRMDHRRWSKNIQTVRPKPMWENQYEP